MQLSPRYRIHTSTELLKKSGIFRNIYNYTLFGIFYMCAKSHESINGCINGRYEHKQATKTYNSVFLIPANFRTRKKITSTSFPDFFRFYITVPWYSILGNLSLCISCTRFNRTKYMSGNA